MTNFKFCGDKKFSPPDKQKHFRVINFASQNEN